MPLKGHLSLSAKLALPSMLRCSLRLLPRATAVRNGVPKLAVAPIRSLVPAPSRCSSEMVRALSTSASTSTAKAAPDKRHPTEIYNPRAQYKPGFGSQHVLDLPATYFQEIPKGGPHRGPNVVKNIWYNHAVVPLYIVSIVAAGLCTWFLYRYFSRNVEIGASARS